MAILCDVTNSPLQASARQPAGAHTKSGDQTALANSAESLVLYAMQKVAAKASRYGMQHNKQMVSTCTRNMDTLFSCVVFVRSAVCLGRLLHHIVRSKQMAVQ